MTNWSCFYSLIPCTLSLPHVSSYICCFFLSLSFSLYLPPPPPLSRSHPISIDLSIYILLFLPVHVFISSTVKGLADGLGSVDTYLSPSKRAENHIRASTTPAYSYQAICFSLSYSTRQDWYDFRSGNRDLPFNTFEVF